MSLQTINIINLLFQVFVSVACCLGGVSKVTYASAEIVPALRLAERLICICIVILSFT